MVTKLELESGYLTFSPFIGIVQARGAMKNAGLENSGPNSGARKTTGFSEDFSSESVLSLQPLQLFPALKHPSWVRPC